MELNDTLRDMIRSLRAANTGMGLKRFTQLVNARLPPQIKVEKHVVRDFLHVLDETRNNETAADTTTPSVPLKPRDETFDNIIKEFYTDYRNAERNYLLNGLLRTTRKKVRTGPDGKVIHPAIYPVAHLRHHVGILLTLKGMKPVTVMVKEHRNDATSRVLTGVVLTCLVPLLEIHDIEPYGFKLHYVAASNLGKRFEGGVWVLADTESPKWPLVRDIFFKHAPERIVPAGLIGAALGYPAKFQHEELRGIDFQDETEENFLREELRDNSKLCCVEAMWFPAGDGDVPEWKAIMSYFKKCQKAVAEFGTVIKIRLNEHRRMDDWLHLDEYLSKKDKDYNPVLDWYEEWTL